MHRQSKIWNSFTTSHRQAGVHPSPGNQGSITPNGDLGRWTTLLRMSPPSSFFPQLYMLSMMLYGVEYCSAGNSYRSCVPFWLVVCCSPPPSPPLAGGVGSRNGLHSV